mmetsp:Transcript_21630/g.34621  ORF Transcript_21630/g.34621 Transcript_21630/m.34621 type:complete len:478 (+) Transcript_21630:135-1568(+)
MIPATVASKCCSSVVRGMGAASRLGGATRGMKIVSATPVNNGKQVDIEFENKSAYRFHTAWIRDASPSQVGQDFYRKSAKTLFEVDKYTAETCQPSENGEKLVVHFKNGVAENADSDEYVSRWLHAFAPHVGQPLNAQSEVKEGLRGTGSVMDALHKNRKAWGKDLNMPIFDAKELMESEEKQAEFLECMTDPGVALIKGMDGPESLETSIVGLPLERLCSSIIGRMNQHPVRATRYGVMHAEARAAAAGADYDHANPLSMHTDHSVYNGTPGYLQLMYQARGTVTSKVCDGIAIAEYIKENHPEDYELLTTVHITHSSRNNIYAQDGAYRQDTASPGATFELVHTHPVITIGEDGLLEKIVQSETKRGVSALPYDKYERFMEAYKLWTNLVEDPRFICNFEWPEHSVVAMNNYRTLHGRAKVPAGMERTMIFGYVQKTIVENRYRLLRQRLVEKQSTMLNAKWLTRLPNQILSKLV